MTNRGSIIYDLSFEDYQNSPGVNQSGLKLFQRSAEHYFAEYLDPQRPEREETKALRLGKMIHTATLEAESFLDRYYVDLDPADYPTAIRTVEDLRAKLDALGVPYKKSEKKSGLIAALLESDPSHSKLIWDDIVNEHMKANEGKTAASKNDFEMCLEIGRRHKAHPLAQVLMEEGSPEVSLFWTDEETGVSCKARLDWLMADGILDVKSTEDASRYAFRKSIADYGYHMQAAFYLDGWRAVTGEEASPDSFIFEAIEKTRPYGLAFYYADQEMIDEGRNKYKNLLRLYAECLRTSNWPGYPTEILPISLPKWALSKNNDTWGNITNDY
jgi:hypothetical protein